VWQVRHPEKYVGSRDVVCKDTTVEGRPAVERDMVAGPPNAPQKMMETITWDEHSGLVTFAFRSEDPDKTGAVTNLLHHEMGLQLLTFTFNMHFKHDVPQAKVR